MGHPPKQRRKFQRPSHPWQKARIEEEKGLVKTYGLKNKREIWKAKVMISGWRKQARRLFIMQSEQAKKEKAELLAKLIRFGILGEKATFDDVLALSVNDVLERRLQTVAAKQGVSKTLKQARQFITHGHIAIGGRRITAPSTLVSKEDEKNIGFYSTPISLDASPAKEPAKAEAKEAEGEMNDG